MNADELLEVPWSVTGGRDAHARLRCTCPSRLFKDSSVADLMKTDILLCGYMDANFFDNVNKEPRPSHCPECKRTFTEQWRRDGVVEVRWTEPEGAE